MPWGEITDRIRKVVFSCLNFLLFCVSQYVDDVRDKISPLSDELKDKIDDLSQDVKDRRLSEKVMEAENHAAQLNDSSAILDGYANHAFVKKNCCCEIEYSVKFSLY